MIKYENLLNLQIMMLILLFIGYLLKKRKILTTSTQSGITDLIINVILPCSIINSFLIDFDLDILIASLSVLLISFGIQFFCLFSSRLFFMKFANRQRKVLEYATICSNASFMGMPLVEGISGTAGLLFASIYLIPQRIFMWSAGMSCFTPSKGKDVLRKVITHPCIIAVIIGLFIMIAQIKLPKFAILTLKTLGSGTTALSMLVIGSILVDVKLSHLINKGVLYFSFIRLILIPSIVLVVCYLLDITPLVTTVSIVLAGMPAGTTTAILANKYSADEQFAVKIVFLSTILSMITIPLLCIVVERLI